MMSRNVATMVGMSFCVLLAACGSRGVTGSGAEDRASQLTRSGALSLLRRNISNLGWRPETCRIPLRLNASIYKTASPHEAEGIMAQLARERSFYQGLVDAGVLKYEEYKTGEGDSYSSIRTYHNYYYSLVPQPGISVADDGQDKWAIFVLDKLSIDEVTGISQEGIRAEIAAKVSYPFTPVANTLGKLRSNYDDQWRFCDCYTVMQKVSQTPSETQNFTAKKFDDGWRIQ